MKRSKGNGPLTSPVRRHGLPLALLAGIVWVAGAAHAAPSATATKWYAATVTSPAPAVVAVGDSETFTVRLTNCSTGVSNVEPKCDKTSKQTLGSANIYVPTANFTVTMPIGTATVIAAAGGTKTWTMTHAGSGVVELRAKTTNDALSPGQSVFAPIAVTALGPLGTYSWDTIVKQANNFSGALNDFVRLGLPPQVEIVSEVCRPGDVECKASDGAGTTVETPVPPAGGQTVLSFSDTERPCGGVIVGTIGTLAIVDPIGYTTPIDITFIYDRAISGGLNVSERVFCLSKDGATFVALAKCLGPTPTLPCEVSRNRTEGHLKFVVRIAPTDPWGGLG